MSAADVTVPVPVEDVGDGGTKNLMADLEEGEKRATELKESSNEEAHLEVKVEKSINTKGFSGIQKWRAALEKVEEAHLDVKHQRSAIEAGPGAEEVIKIMDTIELSLCIDPKQVQSDGRGEKSQWDGMLPLSIGFLWSRVYDSDGMKELVGDKDGIRIFLEVMLAYEYEPEIVQNCVGCLASLTLNPANREMFTKVGGCMIVATSFVAMRKNFTKYPQLPYNFCSLVKVTAVLEKAETLFVDAETHEIIIKMMESDEITDYVMEEGCSALANLLASVENVAPVAITSKGLVRLINILNMRKTRSPGAVISKLIKVIWNMTDDEATHDICFQQNLFLLLKELLELFHEDNEVNSNIFGVLRNLSHLKELPKKKVNDRAVALQSVIEPVVDALEHSHISGVQVKAVGFLMNLTDDEKFKKMVLDQHILESLLIAMRNTADYLPMQRLGMSLLCNLTCGDTLVEGAERFKDARGMLHVKYMVHNNPSDFQLLRAAFGLIRNLSCVSPKHREFVAETHEMIPVIMNAMRRHQTHPIMCRNACSALSALCAEPVYAWEIAKRGGIKMALQSLEPALKMKPRDKTVMVSKCMLLISNLCCVQVGVEKFINSMKGKDRDGPKRKVLDSLKDDTTLKKDTELITRIIRLLEIVDEAEEEAAEKPIEPAERQFFLYVVGGHSDPNHLNTVERMDTRSMKWTSVPEMKYRRYKPACVFSPEGKFLYVFGGHNEEDKLDAVEVLDTEQNKWMELEPMPVKRSHVAGALQPRSPYIYAVGGNDGSGAATGRLKSVVRFNMESNKWEPWGEMSQVRSAPGIAFSFDGDHLYVAGGSDGSTKLQSAERLDIAQNKWEALPDMTSPRSGCCAAVGQDYRFYVMGGYDGTNRMNSCEVYDVASGKWLAGPDMCHRRSGADATTGPDGSIYVAGGTDGTQQHSSVERLTFVDGVPHHWGIVSEMSTRRECPAACFAGTPKIAKPVVLAPSSVASRVANIEDEGEFENPMADDEPFETEAPEAAAPKKSAAT